MPDYEALRGETGGLPPDGIHDAYLDAARLVDTRSGESIVCDWRTTSDPLYQWTSWHRLGGQGLAFTLDFLDALGVDRAACAKWTAPASRTRSRRASASSTRSARRGGDPTVAAA